MFQYLSATMKVSSKLKITLIIFAISSIVIFGFKASRSDCEERVTYENNAVNDLVDRADLFAKACKSELKNVLTEWNQIDLKSESSHILVDHQSTKILSHYHNKEVHYGGVFLPINYDESKSYPLVLWAHGLNQRNPSINLGHSIFSSLRKKMPEYIIVAPSFRGQALVYQNEKYCSDGFFGDAFDGATTDALRLLEVVKERFSIDEQRIAVCGQSRGGTVAMLMAVRDPSLSCAVSIAGPSDFFREDVSRRYSSQYKYQFLSEVLPLAELRKKILRSSPFHFIDAYSNPFLLIHGKLDQTVPLWNAEIVASKMQHQQNFEHLFLDTGHSVGEKDRMVTWIKENNW